MWWCAFVWILNWFGVVFMHCTHILLSLPSPCYKLLHTKCHTLGNQYKDQRSWHNHFVWSNVIEAAISGIFTAVLAYETERWCDVPFAVATWLVVDSLLQEIVNEIYEHFLVPWLAYTKSDYRIPFCPPFHLRAIFWKKCSNWFAINEDERYFITDRWLWAFAALTTSIIMICNDDRIDLCLDRQSMKYVDNCLELLTKLEIWYCFWPVLCVICNLLWKQLEMYRWITELSSDFTVLLVF